MIKKIYTILVLIKNLIIRKKHYTLRFVAEHDSVVKRWYYDFKHWGFSHNNLEMVAGADGLCEKYAKGKDDVTVNIVASKEDLNLNPEEYDMYCAEDVKHLSLWDKILYGRNYTNAVVDENGNLKITTMWICPVTLFVLGRYPKYLYVHIKNNNS